jgi:hypothetical protein
LAEADPADAAWQHDLSASYASLANVYRKQVKMAETRAALGAGHAIVASFAAQHPKSAKWKKDLEWFDQKIAEAGS